MQFHKLCCNINRGGNRYYLGAKCVSIDCILTPLLISDEMCVTKSNACIAYYKLSTSKASEIMHYIVFWMNDSESLLMYDPFSFATEIIYINPDKRSRINVCTDYEGLLFGKAKWLRYSASIEILTDCKLHSIL